MLVYAHLCWHFSEQLIPDKHIPAQASWEADYKQMIPQFTTTLEPCYLFVRLDTRTSLGYEWLLLTYVPDSASVRQKMVYAATRATLKVEFGTGYIKDELHASSKVCIN